MVNTGEMTCPDCGAPSSGLPMCEMCGSNNPPIAEQVEGSVPYIKDTVTAPKGRVRIEVYGPRSVKVQPFCKDVSASPYIILETDLHESLIKELYPKYVSSGSEDQSNLRMIDRRPTNDLVDSRKIHTLKRCWFRPWAFNSLTDESIKAAIRNQYPSAYSSPSAKIRCWNSG